MSEETIDRLRDLENRLTGALITCVRVTPAERPGPRVPSWWHGDEDASQSAVLAMSQIVR